MYGTPVLGANIGGIPELIQVGKTGELFESGNGEDLERKIEKLWGDNKLCEAYSRNCKNISFDTIDGYYEKSIGGAVRKKLEKTKRLSGMRNTRKILGGYVYYH